MQLIIVVTNRFRFLSCGCPIYIRKKPYAEHDGNENVAKQKFNEQKESQYISWPPFTNQQLEMSNFHFCRCCVFFVSFLFYFREHETLRWLVLCISFWN